MALRPSGWEHRAAVVGLRPDTRQETFQVIIEDASQVNQIRLNRSGSLVAVVIDWVKLYVFDGQSGQMLWQARSDGGSIYPIEFLANDDLLVMTSDRTVCRLSGREGQIVWESRANQ